MRYFTLVLLTLTPLFAFAATEGPRMTDSELFCALNLDYPGLENVKAAVASNDLAAAKHEFAEYLRHREKPVYTFDWRARPKLDSRPANVDTKEADLILQRDLPSVNVRHKFDTEIDWTLNPINYKEWTWGLNRHQFWVTLGRAYWATGEERYAREFVYQMTDWVRKCPEPINDSGNSTPTWRTIECGIRMGQTWPEAFHRFLTSPSFDDEAMITMVKSFAEHARHLMRWPTTANWLAMECNGLMHCGVLFPEFKEAESWRKTATERLYAELDRQVYPDGAQIELSTGYHQVSLMNFVMAWRIAKINDIPMPAEYVAKTQKMFDYDLKVMMPNWRLPGLNDADNVDIRPALAEGLKLFAERRDYEWVASSGSKGEKPSFTSAPLPWSGHIVMRSGWQTDDRYMLFDAGPYGYGHQHEDALSFVIYGYGKYILVDPGSYPYDSSDWRRYVISTRAHNTIMVDGCEQHRGGRPRDQYVLSRPMPIKWASNDKFDYASSTYSDGYASDNSVRVKHARTVLFVKPDYWIVTDSLIPADDKPHRYESMFHLDTSGAEIDDASKSVRTTDAKGANLTILPLADDGLSVRIVSGQKEPIVQGWIRDGAYTCRPIPTPIFSREQSGPSSFAYVFYPTPEGGKCPVVGVDALDVKSDSRALGLAVRFDNGRVDYFVQLDKPGKAQFGGFESDGLVTYVRARGSNVIGAAVMDGTRLTHGDQAVAADLLPITDLSRTNTRHKF